jgi:quercetin dioxygenase-like cupin family protein
MQFNFKTHAHTDVSSIKDKVLAYTETDWKNYNFRQRTFKVHEQTNTIPLIWDEKLMAEPKVYDEFKKYTTELNDICLLLTNNIGPGSLATAVLVNLFSKKEIIRHKDSRKFFKIIHRIHIPIVTDPKCVFEIDGEVKHLPEGAVVEINNNNKYHSVKNNSDIDRVHLLIDWLDKEE